MSAPLARAAVGPQSRRAATYHPRAYGFPVISAAGTHRSCCSASDERGLAHRRGRGQRGRALARPGTHAEHAWMLTCGRARSPLIQPLLSARHFAISPTRRAHFRQTAPGYWSRRTITVMGSADEVHVLQFTDLHLYADKDAKRRGIKPYRALEQILEQVAGPMHSSRVEHGPCTASSGAC